MDNQEKLNKAYDLITEVLVSGLQEDQHMPSALTQEEVSWAVRSTVRLKLVRVIQESRRSLPAELKKIAKELKD